MTDILKIIKDLRDRLWAKYGNVLAAPYSQEEIHLTYYAGQVLEENKYNHIFIENGKIKGELNDNVTFYSEKAMHAAFIAGRRVGLKEGKAISETNRKELIRNLIGELEQMKDGENYEY
jgi:hypothetical protein